MLKGRVFWVVTLYIIWRQPNVSEASSGMKRETWNKPAVNQTWKIQIDIGYCLYGDSLPLTQRKVHFSYPAKKVSCMLSYVRSAEKLCAWCLWRWIGNKGSKVHQKDNKGEGISFCWNSQTMSMDVLIWAVCMHQSVWRMLQETHTGLLHSFRGKMNGFHGLLEQRPSSLFRIVGTELILGYLPTRVMEQNVASQTDAALYHKLICPYNHNTAGVLCISGVKWTACCVQTLPHSHGMLICPYL
jgi:hypothetical protein